MGFIEIIVVAVVVGGLGIWAYKNIPWFHAKADSVIDPAAAAVEKKLGGDSANTAS